MFGFLFDWLRELVLLVGGLSGQVFPQKLPAKQEKELLAKWGEGDRDARNQLIEHNLRFVAHIARKYTNSGWDQDDLISIGTIGLIKAVDSYKLDKGSSLATYSARCIENEILMALRASKNLRKNRSLDEPVGSDDEGNEQTIADTLGTPADAVADEVNRRMEQTRLQTAMEKVLTQQEQLVLRLRYGLGTAEKMTQAQVGQKLGVSRSYISRIEERARRKLAKALGE